MEPQLEARYGEILADYLAAGFSTRQLANTYNIAANTLEQIQTLAILVVGALLVMNSDVFTVGMLVAFQMIAGRLSQPVLKLVGLYQELQQVRVAIQRLGDIMNMPQEPYNLVPARAQAEIKGAVVDLFSGESVVKGRLQLHMVERISGASVGFLRGIGGRLWARGAENNHGLFDARRDPAPKHRKT